MTLSWTRPPRENARLAVVQGDPSKEGSFAYRLNMPAGYKIPPHLHKASENVTVLSGVFFIGLGEKFDQGKGQELPVGGFVAFPRTTRTTRGRAARRPSCRCTAWDRPISGS